MIEALFKYRFMQNALVSGLLASLVCGIIGVIIVEKKLVMMTGGIAHISYGGIGLGYLLGFEPIIGAFIFSVCSALGIGVLKRKGGARVDVFIGLLWSLGMALGILFISLMKGYPPDMNSYLFGNILSVTKSDLYLMAACTFFVLLIIIMFFSHWKVYLFDEEFASVAGMNTPLLNYLLLVLIAMTIVVLIRVMGIILVLALLTAPALLSELLVNDFKKRMFLSVFSGMFFCIAGLWLSYTVNLASGASIVLFSAFCCLAVYLIKYLLKIFKTTREKNKGRQNG